jgi:membrane protease YdiL (CAAX protease family)
VEHVIAAVFALGFPALTTPTYAKRRAAILAGNAGLKKREYRETIGWLSAMGVASVLYFVLSGKGLALLGVTWSATAYGVGAVALAMAIVAVLALQVRAVRNDPATREAAREALLPVREYFPTRPDERRLFRGVSFAAGIGEELFYRGFLLWYLGQALPIWGAVVVSSVLFGLAHVMHGAQATVR